MPELFTFSIRQRNLVLKYPWKLSRNTSTQKTNFIVLCSNGKHTGFGEVAPNIRYQETPESIAEAFSKCTFPEAKIPALEFDAWLAEKQLPAALSFGISAAYGDFVRQENQQSWESFLDLEVPAFVKTCYTLPIMDPGEIAGFIKNLNLNRFDWLKVKVHADEAFDLVNQTIKHSENQALMIDGNEAWTNPDDLLRFVEKVKKKPILFLEQPFPANQIAEMEYAKKYMPFDVFADESFLQNPDWGALKRSFDGVNMKFMKAGSLSNGLNLLRQARHYHFKTMVGCMVETTLGMSFAYKAAALSDYADLDGYMVIQEEPFQLLSEADGKVFHTQNRMSENQI